MARKEKAVSALWMKQLMDEKSLIKECGLNINVTSDPADESSKKS